MQLDRLDTGLCEVLNFQFQNVHSTVCLLNITSLKWSFIRFPTNFLRQKPGMSHLITINRMETISLTPSLLHIILLCNYTHGMQLCILMVHAL